MEKKLEKKFGFFKSLDNDDKVILEFLEILLEQKVDYTNAFRKLSCSLETDLEKKDFFSLFHNKKKDKRMVFQVDESNKARNRKY